MKANPIIGVAGRGLDTSTSVRTAWCTTVLNSVALPESLLRLMAWRISGGSILRKNRAPISAQSPAFTKWLHLIFGGIRKPLDPEARSRGNPSGLSKVSIRSVRAFTSSRTPGHSAGRIPGIPSVLTGYSCYLLKSRQSIPKEGRNAAARSIHVDSPDGCSLGDRSLRSQ